MPTVSFEQLGIWIVCAFIALDVLLRVAAHQREKKTATEGTQTIVSPQPLQVKHATEFATKEAHEAFAIKMDTELGRERGARKEIHKEISALQGDVKVLKRDTDSQTRQLMLMDQVLLRLPRKD